MVRCSSTGCEWKKYFGEKCSERKIIIAEQKKPTNLYKKTIGKKEVIKKEDNLTDKIGLKKQDDWIKKVKFI